MKTQHILAIAVCLGVSMGGYAQEQEADSLTGETVIIVKEFEPVIKNGKKINHQPTLQTVAHEKPDFKYDLNPVKAPNNFVPDTIKAAKIKGEPLNDLYRAYVKAGIGNYTNNMAQVHLNSVRSRDFHWGLDIDHLHSNGGIKDLPYNGFLHENVDLYGKKMLKKHIILAGGNFNFEEVYKYGYPHQYSLEEISKNAIKNTFTKYQGFAGIESMINDSSKLNYKVRAQYYGLGLNNNINTENNILITSEFSKFYGTEKSIAGLDIDVNTYNTTSGKTTNTLVKPKIDIRFNGEKWRLNAGFKIGVDAGSTTTFHFYPNAEFKYNVVQNYIVPYVGVTGGLDRNSLNSIRNTNPFLNTNVALKNTSTAYDAYFGIRGVYSSKISYNLKGGYKNVKDMVLFSQNMIVGTPTIDPTNNNAYFTLYDTVGIANVSAQVNYDSGQKWKLMYRLQYNNYDTQREVKAWNLPDFTSDLTLHYNLQSKIVATSSIFFAGSRYIKSSQTTDEKLADGIYGKKLDPYVDLNLGLEYRFTPKASAFVNVNNILSQNYQRWGNYPVQGINVMAGFSYSFWRK